MHRRCTPPLAVRGCGVRCAGARIAVRRAAVTARRPDRGEDDGATHTSILAGFVFQRCCPPRCLTHHSNHNTPTVLVHTHPRKGNLRQASSGAGARAFWKHIQLSRRRAPADEEKMQRLADEARSVFAAATSRFRPASRPEDDHQPAAGVAAATASSNVDMYTSAGQQLTKPEPEPESKQDVLINMSELSVVVRPWNETTEMSELERLVREIKEDTNLKAIVWQASHLEDIGYGIKLLHISCQVADDQVSSSIVEKIEALTDYVQSCDILKCSKAPKLTPKSEPKAGQKLELVKPLPAGTRVAVAGYGRGACVSCTRQFGKLEHTIKFDNGTTVAMKLRNESWTVLRPTAVLSNSSGSGTTGQRLTDQTPGSNRPVAR